MRLISLNDGEDLQMLKSGFGDVRAPRIWWDFLQTAMVELGIEPHPMDKIIFLSFTEADGFDGILGVHVDDCIGGGANLQDLQQSALQELPEASFRARMVKLSKRFKFGLFDMSSTHLFTGCHLTQYADRSTIQGGMKACVNAIEPLTISKERKADPSQPTTDAEKHQLRGRNGSLQWPAAQSSPDLSAGISFQQASVEHSTIQYLLDANKSLRIAKENIQLELLFCTSARH